MSKCPFFYECKAFHVLNFEISIFMVQIFHLVTLSIEKKTQCWFSYFGNYFCISVYVSTWGFPQSIHRINTGECQGAWQGWILVEIIPLQMVTLWFKAADHLMIIFSIPLPKGWGWGSLTIVPVLSSNTFEVNFDPKPKGSPASLAKADRFWFQRLLTSGCTLNP